MIEGKPYSITKEKDTLTFITSSFKAERGSVLHRGIYNYELASMFSALTVSGLIYVIVAFNYKLLIIHYLAIITVFVTTFLLFRRFIFRERKLKVVFNRTKKLVKITWPRLIGERMEEIPFNNIKTIEIGSKRLIPENPDGIQFVERISAQHGSVIPGLGEEMEFVTLVLKLKDGTERLIYAEKIEGRIKGEPEVPLKEIRDFMDGLKNSNN